MKIGNTPAEVRDFLGDPPKEQPVDYRLETRASLKSERLVLGRGPCRVCKATNGLCISETGLPASGPHLGRELMPIATGIQS